MLTAQPHPLQLYRFPKGTDNLTGIDAQISDKVVLELNKEYEVPGYPDYFFIARYCICCKEAAYRRVCLYRRGVVNRYLKETDEPFTLWISNERLHGRKLEELNRDMEEKVRDREIKTNIKKPWR